MGRQSRVQRRLLIVCGLFAMFGTGCTPASLWWLAGGANEKQPAEVPLPAKEGKKTVSVAILTSCGPGLGVDYAGVDRELAGLIVKHMTDDTKDDKHPIKPIELSKVRKAFDAAGRDWQSPAVIGKQLGADYVLDLTITRISMRSEYGPDYNNGKATVQVVVYDTAKPDSALADYVQNTEKEPKMIEQLHTPEYRREFVDRIAVEIAQKHIPHIADRQLSPVH